MVYESIVDEFLLEKTGNRKERPPNTLYVTDLVKACQRMAYFGITNRRDAPLESLRIFKAGDLIEDFWVDILHKRCDIRVLGTQVRAYYKCDDFEIHGRVDALCQHNNTAIVAHEVKSAKTAHWLREPKDNHVAQLQFYLNSLSIDYGQIDYLDKKALLDGKNPIDVSFTVERDPQAFTDLINTAKQLHKAWTTETQPPANPDAWNGKVCNYCQYKDLCDEKNAETKRKH